MGRTATFSAMETWASFRVQGRGCSPRESFQKDIRSTYNLSTSGPLGMSYLQNLVGALRSMHSVGWTLCFAHATDGGAKEVRCRICLRGTREVFCATKRRSGRWTLRVNRCRQVQRRRF
jgi:hypothetical protein